MGVLATDAQHGTRGGGAIHAAATQSVAGFQSATDKAKQDHSGADETIIPPIYVDPAGSDSNTGLAPGAATAKLTPGGAMAIEPGWSRVAPLIDFAAGTYLLPGIYSLSIGGPFGAESVNGVSSCMGWLGKFTNEFSGISATLASTTGTTNKVIVSSALPGAGPSVRSGTGASISSVANFGAINGTMTVNITTLVSGDIGKYFKFVGINGGNCCTARLQSIVAGVSATFTNPQGVVEAGTISWQDSWRYSTLKFDAATPTAALQGIRRQIIEMGKAASGSVKVPAGAAIADGDTLVLTTLNQNGTTTTAKTYEWDSGGGVTAGNIAVAFTAGDSVTTTTLALMTAIRTQNTAGVQFIRTGLDVDSSGNLLLALESKVCGSAGNVTITKTGTWAPTIVGMSGGVGTNLNCFEVNTTFPATPGVTDQFVVEKPAVIIQYPNTFDITGAAATYFSLAGIKFQATTSSSQLHIQGSCQLLGEGCEVDLGGFATTNGFFIDLKGAIRGQGVPIAGTGQGNRSAGWHVHDGNWTIGGDRARVSNVFMLHNLNGSPARSEFTLQNSGVDRVTMACKELQHVLLQGNVVWDGTVFAADTAALKLDLLSEIQITSTGNVIKGCPKYAIELTHGSQGRIGPLASKFNVRSSVHADYRSGCTFDDGGTSLMSGDLGDTELGRTTSPNYQAMSAIRTADGSGVKGVQDAYGNRFEV